MTRAEQSLNMRPSQVGMLSRTAVTARKPLPPEHGLLSGPQRLDTEGVGAGRDTDVWIISGETVQQQARRLSKKIGVEKSAY